MRDAPRFTRTTSEWTADDRRGAIRCRVGRFRMRYAVQPGLYALGRPDADSPVLATANYRLGFDTLRRDLTGVTCWILVLDTGGINVWCAAGAGRFSTEELIGRMQKTRMAEVVRHRTIIVPQLCATGVSAHRVTSRTGFTILFGPVRGSDIPEYLARGCTATTEMRAVRFGMRDRLVLVPMEIGQSLLRVPAFAFAALIYAGLGPGGINLGRAWAGVWPLFALGLGSVFAGSLLVPMLLPYIPFRSFAARGLALGAGVTAALLQGARLAAAMDPFLVAGCCIFFPAASAFMALNFTGASPFTGPSGVRREIRWFIPLAIAAALVSGAALTLSRLRLWGLV